MATLTINTTAQQDARIVEAFGKHLGLTDAQGNPRNATGAEVKAALIEHVKAVVYSHETAKVATAAAAGVDKVAPT